ncbi:hypothetical protein chiPu_0017613 [Chiloscyllium punctatum]|uniref:Uncharacterized protein n=1 Tax=Chiloscyllium punctatum TaxID=137246 RepID=A0A401RHH3_CHIPU|nr:hypothetical protein [Chiloscyllium punctatum]
MVIARDIVVNGLLPDLVAVVTGPAHSSTRSGGWRLRRLFLEPTNQDCRGVAAATSLGGGLSTGPCLGASGGGAFARGRAKKT